VLTETERAFITKYRKFYAKKYATEDAMYNEEKELDRQAEEAGLQTDFVLGFSYGRLYDEDEDVPFVVDVNVTHDEDEDV
jgi:hypothetical protein